MEKLTRRQSLILPSEEPTSRYAYVHQADVADNGVCLPLERHEQESQSEIAEAYQSLSISKRGHIGEGDLVVRDEEDSHAVHESSLMF